MKILYVADAQSIHTRKLALSFRDSGDEVHVASLRPAQIEGVQVHVLPTFGLGRLGYLLAVPALRKLAKRVRPDVVHAHYVTSYGFLAGVAHLRPLLLTAWGTDVLISPQESIVWRWLASRAVKAAAHVTVVAEHMLPAVLALGAAPAKVSAVPFGVDISQFHPPVSPRAPISPLRIISTRNFSPVYSIRTLIEAVHLLRRTGFELRLDLVGDGPLKQELANLVAEWGLEGDVHFHGHVEHTRLIELLSEAHVFVSSALSDGNNVSLNEAMSCGCFPIATEIAANAQWISHGHNGLLFRAGDATALAEMIATVKDAAWCAQVAVLNRQIVETRADWQMCVNQMRQLYIELQSDMQPCGPGTPIARPHICFFGDGASVHTQRWLREIADRGFQVSLITRRPWGCPGIAEILLSERHGMLQWFFCVPDVRRIVRRLRPDIVHGHYITSYGFLAAASGARLVVQTAWGSDILVTPKHSRFARVLTRWSLSRARLVTADSLDTLTEIEAYAVPARLEQVQWGVNLQGFPIRGEGVSEVLGVVSLREWAPNYNVSDVIDGFAGALKRLPNGAAHLHLLGGGTLEHTLRAQVLALGIEEHVTFYGHVNESRLRKVLMESDISISIPTSDATAMSVLESMAAGLAMIVSDLPANRQWVDASGGHIVARGDGDALAGALVALVRDAPGRRAMGRRNRAMVEVNASREVEMDRMAGLYKEMLASPGD